MSFHSNESTNSLVSHNLLNEARIESNEAITPSSSSTESQHRSCKKLLPHQESIDFNQSISQIIKSIEQEEILDTPKDAKKRNGVIDLTKTLTIKGKKGRLYEEICPVCLTEYSDSKAVLFCRHMFCFDCIWEWSKTSTACPCCRKNFDKIKKIQNEKSEMIAVEKKEMVFREEDYFVCYVCLQGDNEHVLLICDMCDFYCCHIFCDPSLNNTIPEGDWACRNCISHLTFTQENLSDANSISLNEEPENKPVATRTRSSRATNSEAVVLQRLRRRR